MQAIPELRTAKKEAIAHPRQNQPGDPDGSRGKGPLKTVPPCTYGQAQLVCPCGDDRLESTQRQPGAEDSKRQPQVEKKRSLRADNLVDGFQ